MPTLLEYQYNRRANLPTYRPDEPGFIVVNVDDNPNHIPPSIRVDSGAVEQFIIENNGNPDHARRTAIGLYAPGSSWDEEGVRGFCKPEAEWIADEGVRSSIVFMHYDPNRVPDKEYEAQLNFTLRHELGHLLQEYKVPLYERESLATKIRLGGVATTLATTETYMALTQTPNVHISPVGAVVTFLGIAVSSLAGMALTSRIGTEIALQAIDSNERDADKFAKKHADFNPITLLK